MSGVSLLQYKIRSGKRFPDQPYSVLDDENEKLRLFSFLKYYEIRCTPNWPAYLAEEFMETEMKLYGDRIPSFRNRFAFNGDMLYRRFEIITGRNELAFKLNILLARFERWDNPNYGIFYGASLPWWHNETRLKYVSDALDDGIRRYERNQLTEAEISNGIFHEYCFNKKQEAPGIPYLEDIRHCFPEWIRMNELSDKTEWEVVDADIVA